MDMMDLEKMYGKIDPLKMERGYGHSDRIVHGINAGDYQRIVIAYTKGEGRLSCSFQDMRNA